MTSHPYFFYLGARKWSLSYVYDELKVKPSEIPLNRRIIPPSMTPAALECAGLSPKCFGIVEYQTCEIWIAGHLSSRMARDAIRHEIGHVIAWSVGRGDTTEGDANLFAIIIEQLLSEDLFPLLRLDSPEYSDPPPTVTVTTEDAASGGTSCQIEEC
jgi:hypothetical protein